MVKIKDKDYNTFKELCEQLINLVINNYGSMAKIILEEGKVEILTTEVSVPTLKIRD